jgi:hypothetical protein
MRLPRLFLAAVLLSAHVAAADEDDGPVTAARPSVELGRAMALLGAGREIEPAVIFHRVARGETKDDAPARQVAELHLGVALFRLQLYDASLRVLGAVAASPTHAGFHQAARWLVALDTVLPDPARVAAFVGRYERRPIASMSAGDRERDSRLNYLIGKNAYDDRRFEVATEAFDAVDPSSTRYLAAQMMAGMSLVQQRRATPASKRFLRVAAAVGEKEKAPERLWLRDLAWISVARVQYSSSVSIGLSAPAPNVSGLHAAAKYWRMIPVESPFWPEAMVESSWLLVLAGDDRRALGNLHNLESGYFEATLYPEADVVRGFVSFTLCQYDDALTLVARSRARYSPIRRDLRALLDRLTAEGEQGTLAFHGAARAGRASVPETVRPIVETLRADRPIARHLAHLRILDAEEARLGALPDAFRRSHLGEEVEASLRLARLDARRGLARRVRLILARRLDDLDRQRLDMTRLAIDVTRARAADAAERVRGGQLANRDQVWGVITPDFEHTIWPFDGEFWRDELGSYRQTVTSRCPR